MTSSKVTLRWLLRAGIRIRRFIEHGPGSWWMLVPWMLTTAIGFSLFWAFILWPFILPVLIYGRGHDPSYFEALITLVVWAYVLSVLRDAIEVLYAWAERDPE